MNDAKAVPTASKIITIFILVIVVIASITLIYFVLTPRCCEDESDYEFGDRMLNGTYSADAYALTTDGLPVGEGIETLADPPTVAFNEDFEGSETWTLDDATTDSTGAFYWGVESAYMDPSIDGSASMLYTFTTPISIDSDETIETYFYILASATWDSIGDDYFALRVSFTGGKSLLYVMLGAFVSSDPDEMAINVGSQVTAKGMWVGINLQRIDDDYVIQFGSSLPIPSIISMEFVLESSTGSENVYVDEMEVVTLPRALASGSFWKKIPSGEKVSSYFVEVDYTVLISGDIDPNSVHAEFKLWIEVYDGDSPTTLLLSKTLIQDEIVPDVDANVLNTWTSKAYALPEDGSVLGDDLIYKFYILVKAWGELVTSPGDFLEASDDNNGESFDSLRFEFVVVEGSIDVVITSVYVLGSIGSVMTIVGIAKARKRGKKDTIVDLKMSEKESWYN